MCIYLTCIQVGPKIEFLRGDVFEDEEMAKILPFLALPDGAHLVRHSCALESPLLTLPRLWKTIHISTWSRPHLILRPFLESRESFDNI